MVLDYYLDSNGSLVSETGDSVPVTPEDDFHYTNDQGGHGSNRPCVVYATVNGVEYLDIKKSRELSPRYSAARILEEAQKTRPDVQPLGGLERVIVEDRRSQAREKRENKPKERHLLSHQLTQSPTNPVPVVEVARRVDVSYSTASGSAISVQRPNREKGQSPEPDTHHGKYDTHHRGYLDSQRQQRPSNRELSRLIKTRLNKLGETQTWLAEEIGVTRAAVSLYANGKLVPKEGVLEKLYSALGVRT